MAGYELLVEPKDLTLLAIYQAIDGPEQLFAIHDEPNPACAVGQKSSIHWRSLYICLAGNGRAITGTDATGCARSASCLDGDGLLVSNL